MRLARYASAVLAVVLWALALPAPAQVPVPPLTARVTDLSGALTPEQRAALEQRLAAFESRKGSQIAVLLLPTTQPDTIEQYGIRVGEQAKVGRKNVDDGAILIVAVNDRALRIEVGYGLEGALPDITARRIIEEYIVPRFRQGDFYGGIEAGVTRIMAAVEGEPLPPPRTAARERSSEGVSVQTLLLVGFMLIFVVGSIVRATFGRFLGSGVIGAIGTVAGWLLLGSLLAGVVLGLVALFLSLMGGGAGVGRSRRGWGGGIPMGGGWGGGGWGGGGWSGGGGGWSGGGGSFGGGGASGRW
jgi:uncharacterized protein